MLLIILKTAHDVFFALNNLLLIFEKVLLSDNELSDIIISRVSLLTRNLNSVIFAEMHELNKVMTIIIINCKLQDNSDYSFKLICNQKNSKLIWKLVVKLYLFIIDIILKFIKVMLFIEKQRDWNKLYDIEIVNILALINCNLSTSLHVNHYTIFFQHLMMMKNLSFILIVHLILHKNIHDSLKNARIECHFLLFKSLNIIKHENFKKALIFSI